MADETRLNVKKKQQTALPEGFRVPTKTQWDGVRSNNPRSTVGIWSTVWNDHTKRNIPWPTQISMKHFGTLSDSLR
jgi:hypothetical protein